MLPVYQEFNQALKETGIAAEVVHVSDIAAIMNQGIIFTPALAVDSEAKVSGRVPSVKELSEIFAKEV
ncbi:thioredoxin family protein [Methanosphaerula subterraneus]|uniref:thioredoxin family protein n=1 Tax=Methanosphaerula subterraneus TaxID=3350244 RepID=UPI003F87DA6B